MTTLPSEWTEDEYPDQDTPEDIHGSLAGHTVIPVHVVHDESVRVAPEFCGCMTWTVPQYGPTGVVPVQLLQRRYKRYKAKFLVTMPAAGSIIINSKQEPLTGLTTPQGFTLTLAAAGIYPLPEYDAMQPLYAVGSIAGITVSVFDESYGEVAT